MRAVSVVILVSSIAGGSVDVMRGSERWALRPPGSDQLGQDWEAVDFTLLEEEIRLRGFERDQSSRPMLFSLQFAFSNKLRTDRFLAPVQPQEFVGMVAEILKLNRETALLILEGRKLAARSDFDLSTRRRCKELIHELGRLSRNLKKRFVGSFLEARGAAVDFSVLQEKGHGAFRFYLIQADKLNQQLTAEIDSYFLDPNPGAIDVPEFGKASISVLAEAMIRLSDSSRKWID